MNENQKKTTDEYRNNWDAIFKKDKSNEFDRSNGGVTPQPDGSQGVQQEETHITGGTS